MSSKTKEVSAQFTVVVRFRDKICSDECDHLHGMMCQQFNEWLFPSEEEDTYREIKRCDKCLVMFGL